MPRSNMLLSLQPLALNVDPVACSVEVTYHFWRKIADIYCATCACNVIYMTSDVDNFVADAAV